MKVSVVLLSLSFACSLFAAPKTTNGDPLTELVEGNYLGSGFYRNTNGDEGNYVSYAQVSGYEMRVDQVVNGQAMFYHFDFDFDYAGYFEISVSRQVANYETNSTIYNGFGYCGSFQCHYYVNLGMGFVEETITFEENRIYKLGSLHLGDGLQDPNYQMITWEDNLTRVSSAFGFGYEEEAKEEEKE